MGHVLFIGPAALFDLLPDFLRVRIEDGHHFRLGDLRVHQLEHGLKQAEFFCRQIGLGKNLGLDKAVIRNQQLPKQIARAQSLAELAVPVTDKGQLHAQGKPLRVGVKLLQKRIFLKLLQQQIPAEVLGQPRSKGGLTGADVAFDRDVCVRGFHGVVSRR